jgi:hypothetical protein
LVVGATGADVVFFVVGAAGAVGAIVAAGVTGLEVPEGEVGVVCSTGTTPVSPVFVDNSACWVFQAKLVTMLTNAVAETPSAAIRERCAGCGFRFMISHHLHLRHHHHHLMDLGFRKQLKAYSAYLQLK